MKTILVSCKEAFALSQGLLSIVLAAIMLAVMGTVWGLGSRFVKKK